MHFLMCRFQRKRTLWYSSRQLLVQNSKAFKDTRSPSVVSSSGGSYEVRVIHDESGPVFPGFFLFLFFPFVSMLVDTLAVW